MSLASTPTVPHLPAETREALLHAAGEVFAERGYHEATVRGICRRAGANVAAVNYHFGDKEQLYRAVLRYAHTQAAGRYTLDFGVRASDPPEAKLRSFVHGFLSRLLDSGPGAWHGKLMAKEMIDPTDALHALIQERIRPMADLLRQIVAEILGPGAGRDVVRWCGCSIVSQCLFYAHCRSVVRHLFPEQTFTAEAIEQLADHITRFSLAGLKSYARPRRARRK